MFNTKSLATEFDIVEHLISKWSPSVILLGGSRASGTCNSLSDWDLYLVGDFPSQDSFSEQFCGQHLDVELRPFTSVPGHVLQIYYGPVQPLLLLKDSEAQLGRQIVEQTSAAYELGPAPKSREHLEGNRSEMTRIFAKIKSHASDPEACFTNLGFFHRLAIQFWFELRGRWALPPYKALPIIRKEDTKFSEELACIAHAGAIEDKLNACAKIEKLIWGN